MKTPKAIVMMEDHDKAYYAWKERSIRARTLVHVDAHIDFGWIPEIDLDDIGSEAAGIDDVLRNRPLLNPFAKPRTKMVTIGNYICPAMRDGMVDTFYWVVPDESFRRSKGKRHIIRQLERLLKIKKYACGSPRMYSDHIRCRILDRDLIVCPLAGLKRVEGPVLLDIDVDFLLTRFMWDDLDPGRVPWIFPEDLHARLASKLGEIDVLTIAYSVEGGFTPLKFKYFGDELRCLFGGEALVTTRYKRAALMCEQQGKYADAAAAYEQTLQADDRDASGYYNLALLHMNGLFDRDGKAVYYYNEAVRRDRTYSTRYNNYGIIYLQRNKPKKAEAEFQKILRLDADNTAALNGLGYVSLTQRRYDKAGAFFDRCLAIDAKYPEARIGKAIVCVKKGLLAEAETLFFGLTQDHPEEAEAYWWLGRIAQKRRDVSLAINCYKDAVMRGGEGPVVHLILARLYIQKRFYFRAFEELKRSFDALRALS